jgi:acetyl esterase/lipase
MRYYHTFFLSCFFTFCMDAQTVTEMALYPTGLIPNALPAENLEKTAINQDKIAFTTQTSVPTLTLYQPEKPNGQAVVICPGGGYFGTAGDHEGIQVAKMLNAAGVTALVLKYRVPEERTCSKKHLAPLQDAQQAIRIARKNAAAWGYHPRRIGILGFSAGGHLAAMASTHFNEKADPNNPDTTSLRPDFAVLIYPVISFQTNQLVWLNDQLLGKNAPETLVDWACCEKNVRPDSPPTFLTHCADDETVPVEHSLDYYTACRRQKIPTEMHLYPKGGHGFGMENPATTDRWNERLLNWLKQL